MMNWYRHKLPIVSVLALSLGVTFLLWRHEKQTIEIEKQAQFERAISERRVPIEQSMVSYEYVLRGVQGLFASLEGVKREEVENYVEALRLDPNFAAIEGFGVLWLVRHAEKEAHVAAMRAAGFPSYAIKPEGRRDQYVALTQIAPFTATNADALGYDAYSDPERRSALEQARDSGAPAATGKIELIWNSNAIKPRGFMMYLPIYKQGMPHETMAERRANIAGWVTAAFNMDHLMASMYRTGAARTDVKIYDGVALSERSLMYDSGASHARAANGDRLVGTEYIQVAGRTWTLVVSARPEFALALNDDHSALIGTTGVVLSLFLTLLTWVMSTARGRATALAREMTMELREAKEHFELLFHSSPDGALITDVETGRIVEMNEGFAALTGYRSEDVIGKAPDSLQMWVDDADRRRFTSQLARTGACENLEARFRKKDGSEFYGMVSAKLTDLNGLKCSMAVVRDITERKEVEERIRRMAQYDALTNLPNRALCDDRLRHALTEARRDKKRLALMFLDLDNFKPINDTLGHHVGDSLLKAVAKRIQGCLRESDTVARIGGDEFLVLLPSIDKEYDAIEVAEKIRNTLNQAFNVVEGQTLSVSSSIGIAVYPDHGSDEKQLMRNADDAMYRAKEAGRNRVQLYVSRTSVADAAEQDEGLLHLHWHESYECGNPAIDADHKKLFSLANNVIQAALSRNADPESLDSAFAQLLAHAKKHFAEEEAALAAHHFEGLEVHASAHKRLVERALELREAAAGGYVTIGELVTYLADDLVAQHILKPDRSFHALFKNNLQADELHTH